MFKTIKELKEQLKNNKITSSEILDETINDLKKYDPIIGSTLNLYDKDSIKNISVKNTDKSNNLLLHIPGLIKANICQNGRITNCASKMLEHYKAPYDATVVSRLNKQGALIMGDANMDEFAMGSSTETSKFKITRNPWDLSLTPGGSSGGPAAAVAAGMVPWALGSDTGGSIRQPAAFCSIVGLKPTYGLVSRYGLVAYGSSLDTIGPLTKTVYDNALVLSAIAGHDPKDSTSLNTKSRDYTRLLNGKLKDNLTLGIIEDVMVKSKLNPEVYEALSKAIEHYKKLGAKIKYIKLPKLDHAAAVYFIISRAEAASNFARFTGVEYGYRSNRSDTLSDMYKYTRSEGFGKEVQRRILIGNYVLSSGHEQEYYNIAQKVRGLIRQEILDSFKDVDLLFVPGSPTPAFKINAFSNDKLAMDLQDIMTCPANLSGIPAIAVPCGFTKDKLPIGFQLFGPELSEELLYQTAYAYEQTTEWHTMYPDPKSWSL